MPKLKFPNGISTVTKKEAKVAAQILAALNALADLSERERTSVFCRLKALHIYTEAEERQLRAQITRINAV